MREAQWSSLLNHTTDNHQTDNGLVHAAYSSQVSGKQGVFKNRRRRVLRKSAREIGLSLAQMAQSRRRMAQSLLIKPGLGVAALSEGRARSRNHQTIQGLLS
ncbi:hypothetical protein CgunFtcFv8_019565 [Champsocephalus gunnari]|uniref:Uncharacterized protein n=1 Tax=Champsocephalus gunnari TaxID=52237 RepID=A0AAN8DQ93_CHAGU|nr:hypothetical protein CgunFtcFv8_019565 [Champsocephalus gunnari]